MNRFISSVLAAFLAVFPTVSVSALESEKLIDQEVVQAEALIANAQQWLAGMSKKMQVKRNQNDQQIDTTVLEQIARNAQEMLKQVDGVYKSIETRNALFDAKTKSYAKMLVPLLVAGYVLYDLSKDEMGSDWNPDKKSFEENGTYKSTIRQVLKSDRLLEPYAVAGMSYDMFIEKVRSKAWRSKLTEPKFVAGVIALSYLLAEAIVKREESLLGMAKGKVYHGAKIVGNELDVFLKERPYMIFPLIIAVGGVSYFGAQHIGGKIREMYTIASSSDPQARDKAVQLFSHVFLPIFALSVDRVVRGDKSIIGAAIGYSRKGIAKTIEYIRLSAVRTKKALMHSLNH